MNQRHFDTKFIFKNSKEMISPICQLIARAHVEFSLLQNRSRNF